MVAGADTDVVLGAAYVAVAVVLVVGWVLDDPHARDHSRPCWMLAVLAVVVMALARIGGIAGWVTDALRDVARDAGWYRSRRPVQASVVGLVILGWALIGVLLAGLLHRHRRYVPMLISLASIGAFATVRLVSLHQLDALLRRRPVGKVRLADLIDGILLALVVVTAWVTPRFRSARPITPAAPAPPTVPSPGHGRSRMPSVAEPADLAE